MVISQRLKEVLCSRLMRRRRGCNLRYIDYWQISRMLTAKPSKGEIRSPFLAAHNLWCNTIQYYQARTQKYDRVLRDRLWPCDELQQVFFLATCYPSFWWQRLLLPVTHPGRQVRLVRASSALAQNLVQEQAQAAAWLLQRATF